MGINHSYIYNPYHKKMSLARLMVGEKRNLTLSTGGDRAED